MQKPNILRKWTSFDSDRVIYISVEANREDRESQKSIGSKLVSLPPFGRTQFFCKKLGRLLSGTGTNIWEYSQKGFL